MFYLAIFLLATWAHIGFCCFSVGPDGRPIQNANLVDPISVLVGSEIVTENYNNEDYIGRGGGPAKSPSELHCDFESSCCWVSVTPPEDALDWRLASGAVDPQKMVANFGVTGSDVPRGQFLLVSDQSRKIGDEARFTSCSVECADSEVQVRFRHWASSGVLLRVCQQDTFNSDPATRPLINCQDVPSRSSPGPTSIFMPPGQLTDIVIVASGFDSESGSVAMIDDITVDFRGCAESKRRQPEPLLPAKTLPPAVCTSFCTFEDGTLCTFIDGIRGVALKTDTPYEVKEGRFQNRVTGVKGSSQGRYYATAYLYPGETAGLETPQLNTTEDYVIRFDHYEATFQIYTKIFLDNINTREIFTTDPQVTKKDREWKTASVIVPKGTNRVIIMSMNIGSNQGAAAIDGIHWFKATSPNAEAAFQPIDCS